VQIADADIVPIMRNEQGSGNGTLDLILLIDSNGGGVAGNSSGAFNGDDANVDFPTGSNIASENESYITSMGEIKAFYRLNFPDGSGGSTVDEIALFVDVNETGQVNDILLDNLEIVINFDQTFNPANDERNNPHAGDVPSNRQTATGSGYTGGTVEAQLDNDLPKVLPLNNQGGGWADQAIFTGLDPFAYADDVRVLFHWESSAHDNGGDVVFLSGEVSPADVTSDIPEPALVPAAIFLLTTMIRRRGHVS
jgi:hypothetical protein